MEAYIASDDQHLDKCLTDASWANIYSKLLRAWVESAAFKPKAANDRAILARFRPTRPWPRRFFLWIL